jgi:hypothetical protein
MKSLNALRAIEYVLPQTGVRKSLNVSKQKNATKVALKKEINSVEET